MSEPQNDPGPADRVTLLVTNLTKLAGVVLGLHEGFKQHADIRVLAFAVLLVAGVQAFERWILNLMGGDKR